jgi:hypothetical protein
VLRLRSVAMMAATAAVMLMTIPTMLMTTSTATAQASVAKPPVPPAGFQGTPVNPATARGATIRMITLNPETCAEYNRAYPGTVPNCQAKLYSYGQSNLTLPKGTAAASGYWYWSAGDTECPPAGCGLWSAHLTMDGVANGSHVYQWNVGCTASGYGESCTWDGYFHNGGGWPYYSMQFGEDGQFCVAPFGVGCFNNGIRQSVTDSGRLTGFYDW